MDRAVLAQLTQLYMTVKLECPFYEVLKYFVTEDNEAHRLCYSVCVSGICSQNQFFCFVSCRQKHKT